MYAIYLMFIIANILMIPLGIVMIRTGGLRTARAARVGDAGDHAVLRRRLVRDRQQWPILLWLWQRLWRRSPASASSP
jgi:hypothetical protein